MRAERPDRPNFYLTTPIYYVNGPPHIGHFYTTVAGDVLARYHRLRGERVFFLTGTDEHGAKVARTAQQQGLEPQQFVDGIVAGFQKMWERMHVSYDRFLRTTEAQHVATVQEVFRRLLASGDVYRGEYQGWYCVPCETYLRETEVAERCCPDCGRPVEQVAQPAYFFRASHYAERLVAHLEEHPEFVQPESRRREVLAYLEGGLRDTCVSRVRSAWDIPVPGDDTQSVYVWFDALFNYLSAVGYPDPTAEAWAWWPPQLQLMAKDILTRFHATLWPALLMALDLPLPETLFAHGWWVTDAGDKMSKSKGNALDPWEIARELAEISTAPTRVAVDALRYFFLREVTFGLDGSFSMNALLGRFNADLANDLGNLLNRSLPLIERYRGGTVPQPGPGAGGLAPALEQAREGVAAGLDSLDFRGALEALWGLLAAANKFVDLREPWTLHRESKDVELDAVLYDLADTLRAVALLLEPFMPVVAEEIWERLGLTAAGVLRAWSDLESGRLPAGLQVQAGKPLFPRVDLVRARQRREAEADKQSAPSSPPPEAAAAEPAYVSFAQFQQLDLRVARVLEVAPVPGADKLYRLLVDAGEETPRQIVAGLAQHFRPEELVGRNVVIVANLEPAVIRGVRSEGMLLAAGEPAPLALVTLDRDCPPGAKVR